MAELKDLVGQTMASVNNVDYGESNGYYSESVNFDEEIAS